MTTCLISQPRLFPGLHYLDRVLAADVFVVLDTVRFTPRHEENRCRLKASDGAQWLTIPMRRESREQLVQDTRIDHTQHWLRKALHTLDTLYGPAPFHSDFSEEIREILERPHESLLDITRASWEPAFRLLEPQCEVILASDLEAGSTGQEQLLAICREVGADRYLSGAFGREYLDAEQFEADGIELAFHAYDYPEYSQRFGDFVPFLSYLDVLFNTELDRRLVESGRTSPGSDHKEPPS